MGSLVTSLFSAGGPPFFGLLFDYTETYYLSFNIFIGMLFTSPGSVCACDRRRNAECVRTGLAIRHYDVRRSNFLIFRLTVA
jgi:hypothetical protein